MDLLIWLTPQKYKIMVTEKMNEILQLCCNEFEVTFEEVKSKSRKIELVYCRKIFAIIMKEKFDLCNEKIAKFLNCTQSNIYYLYNRTPINRNFKSGLSNVKFFVNNDKI